MNKSLERKINCGDNHFHDIFRLFDVLPIFFFSHYKWHDAQLLLINMGYTS